MTDAIGANVCARRVEELFVWRVAVETRQILIELTSTRPLSRDFDLWDDLRETANSIEANICEGFARFRNREFANFLRYARALTHELLTHATDAHDRRYITDANLRQIAVNCRTLSRALPRLILYLEKNGPPG
jgi:four helix bundle protein